MNSGHSIFMYGPPGNGKTVMSRAIRRLLAATIAIPHALDADGNIIRFFDPTMHEPIEQAESDDDEVLHDRRWVNCRRPMVTVGGELTLEALALNFNPRAGSIARRCRCWPMAACFWWTSSAGSDVIRAIS